MNLVIFIQNKLGHSHRINSFELNISYGGGQRAQATHDK
jgi:hypothetical protein